MPAPFSPDTYDLSEAALKELYLDRDDDDVDIAKFIAEADEPSKGDKKEQLPSGRQSAGRDDVAPSLPPAMAPLRAPPRELTSPSGRPAGKTKSGGKIAVVILGVAAVLAIGWVADRPTQKPTSRAADTAKPSPAIAGLLHVADFAAGRKIDPGQSYGVDLPAGKVRIAVVTGEVRLTSKGGESLRACSNQPFVIDAAPGPADPAPLITACGREPALLQAEIPPPPLPAPAPVVAISPATLRAGSD